jgi:DNA-binding transcriptional regulator YhcF (GntR family)
MTLLLKQTLDYLKTRWREDKIIPSTRAIAAHFGISQTAANLRLRRLRKAGKINKVDGRFVPTCARFSEPGR